MIVNKIENLLNNGLCYPGRPQNKIERKWKERSVLEVCLRTEKKQTSEQESDVNTNYKL